ncbi:class I SAM-dependent methyltransferase [Candidatus Woesearchaeota archaeon]|nr:class I SAM-dependent methyltransferase [Candidatus Woesearchaeota archaeon]
MQPPATSNRCKICSTPLFAFLSLGRMPIANAFLSGEDLLKPEFFYHLEAGYCPGCHMVQLLTVIPYEMYLRPDQQQKRNYLFFSSTSSHMAQHFSEFAAEITGFLKPDSLVLDVGSNDGITLQAFDRQKYRVLGIEPAHNVAEIARGKGIETLTEFFTEQLAEQIVRTKGKARAILSSNVILNIADLNAVMRCINILLEDDGIFVFEDPYLPLILQNNTYDQFYDEHIYYFTAHAIASLVQRHGMVLFDARQQEVHGGSMRFYIKRRQNISIPISPRLAELLYQEEQQGLASFDAYRTFASRADASRRELIALLRQLKSQGKRIAGYAAASKGTIVTNYCKLTPDIIEYVADSTPEKQGLYTPGMHIPVVSPEHFRSDHPDYAVVFAWNHIKEIMEKEQEYLGTGGRFIVPFPRVRII